MSRNHTIHRSMLSELLENQPSNKKRKLTSTAPISTLLLNGQRAFDEKRYNDAIRLFSDAIENLRDHKADLLHMYNLRIAALEQIEDLNFALKDAKRMIRLDRLDYRGYLNCARLEQKSGNPKEAVRICQYGLKSLSPLDKARPRVEKCLARNQELLRRAVVFEKCRDPMITIPAELMDLVLSGFDYREIVAILRVSKIWWSRLRTMNIITQTINTGGSPAPLDLEQMKSAFSRLSSTPRSLHLSRLNESAARYVSSELKHWIRWESLTDLALTNGKILVNQLRYDKFESLRKLQLRSVQLLAPNVAIILRKCPVLEHAAFEGQFDQTHGLSRNVVEIDLSQIRNDRLISLHILNTARPCASIKLYPKAQDDTRPVPTGTCIFENLELLHLGGLRIDDDEFDFSAYSRLKSLFLQDYSSRSQALKTPVGLQQLKLHGETTHDVRPPCLVPSDNLSSFSVSGIFSIECLQDCMRQGLSAESFRSLSMSDFITIPGSRGMHFDSDLSALLTRGGTEALLNVEVLSLRDDNLMNEAQPTVFDLFPNVKSLEIQSYSITEAFLTEQLKSTNNKIESVTLRNCQNVSQKVCDWARQRGVDVKFVRTNTTF